MYEPTHDLSMKQMPSTALSAGHRIMISQTLRKSPMFSDLPMEALDRLTDGCRLQRLAKGDYLFHEGEPADGFYVVHTGAVNVHRVTEDGREQVIRVFYPGESLGEVVIVGDQSYPASARTAQESQVILVPTKFFRQQIQHDPDLALRILASMSMHLRYLIETVEGLKLKQAESRVVQWLLRQLQSAGITGKGCPELTLPLAKHLLASQLGITSETLSRVFSRLRDEGLVEVKGKQVTFLQPGALQEFLVRAEG